VGCRPGFTLRVEHMCGSDGEQGQALPGIRLGGGDWSGQRARHDTSGGGIHGALSRAVEEAHVHRAQRQDWGREQGTDAWG
jgi:hypothetical protein